MPDPTPSGKESDLREIGQNTENPAQSERNRRKTGGQTEKDRPSSSSTSVASSSSPRIVLEANQQQRQPEGIAIVEAFGEVPSTPVGVPSSGGGGEGRRPTKSGTSPSTSAGEEEKGGEKSKRSFGSLETSREGEETAEFAVKNKSAEAEEGGREACQKQQHDWHKNRQHPQTAVVAPAGGTKLELAKKKTAPSSSWFGQMLGGGLCKCLFGGGPSSSDAEKEDAENPLGRKRSILQGGGREKEKQRIVRANDFAFNAQFAYADNFIRTSKYTLLTFIPYNLYQQFTRIANFYFLVLLGLQFVPQIQSMHWIYTVFPLSFVLICSAIKEGYDDLQRHRNDKQVNKRITYVVRNNRPRLAHEEWMEVRVGDIIRMDNEHFVAADLLLLSSSETHGICYIETAELDGETNLKTRVALPETAPLGDILKDMAEFDGKIICEAPNNRLGHFEGRLEWKGKKMVLDNKNLLLRGCRIRNTRWCYGLVVFAGKDTKLMRNSGESPTKRTSLDRFLNLLILGIVLFLLAMCLICTVMTGFWEQIVGRHFRVFLPWDNAVPSIDKNLRLTTMSRTEEDEESRTIASSQVFFISTFQFFSYMIVLNTVVPISLYISVEMIRLVHSKFINNDMKMYDEKTDTPARARTSTLNEELGQVQYVFSDKTGTLTQNIMLFKKCSINGRSYGDVMTDRGEIVDIDEARTPGLDFSWNAFHETHFRFYDKTLVEDVRRGSSVKEVQEFWRLLAICHTVMPERKAGNRLEYQAQSPDEAALTSAARNFGFVFQSRTPHSVTLTNMIVDAKGKEEVYEMLHILDFDNVRKRMSVLVRDKKGRIKLYSKGADTMILERISARETSELLKSATLQHLDKFATDGLRTLCLAYKNIDPEYCEQWMQRLKEAQLDMANKEKRVDALYEEMEKDMVLLGATAIEDKLQDGVPQTIATLAAANIKIWVLTGDKTETAINIGYSCRLLTEDMREVFIIDGKDEKEVEVQLKDIKRRIQCAKVPQHSVGVSSFYLPPRTPICELSPAGLDSPQGGGMRSPPKSPPTMIVTSDQQSSTFPVIANGSLPATQSPRKMSCGGQPMMDGGGTELLTTTMGYQNGGVLLEEGAATTVLDDNPNGDGGYALVINGDSLAHALKKKYEKTFLEIGCNCVSIICCRVTPLQKAQVVDLVKRNIKAVTLAIGDGANDVSMIRTAHIGVGISGKEGMQAVLSSDFSIGQFRYLERLLLVHGRWSYLRMCKFLRYFFYKNFAFTLTHFWYSFFCGFSAQTVFDPVLISLYNLCFTALPVLFMGMFDQDVSDSYSLRFPRLYIPGQFNLFFNMRIFIYSIIHGMISSLVLFFIPFGTLYHAISADGRDMNDYAMLAFTCFTALVLVVNGQIAFDTSYWTWCNWFVVLGSLGFYFLVVLIIYQFLPITWLYPYVPFSNVGVVYNAATYPNFWLSLLLICAILLLPILGNRFFWFDTHPSYADRLRARHRLYGEEEEEPRGAAPSGKQPPRTAMTRSQRRGSLRSGYAFSHSPGFGELIAKGTLFKNLENRIPSFHRGHHQQQQQVHSNGGDHLHPNQQHQQKEASPIRRFSLLKALPSLSLLGHHGSANPPPPSSSASPILLTPNTLTTTTAANGGGAASSVTQFSPSSSNTTTTTTLLSQAANEQQNGKFPPQAQHSRGRRGTVDSLVIEHLPGSADYLDPIDPSLVSHIPVNEEEEEEMDTARLRPASAAVLVPLRVPSPDLVNTAHNLVINADMAEERPLPSNWHYNPTDGTLQIPELEQPPQPGTPPASSQPARKTFVSKKRREMAHSDSVGSSTSSSSGTHIGGGQQQLANKPPPPPPMATRRPAPLKPERGRPPETKQQQQGRMFKGKRQSSNGGGGKEAAERRSRERRGGTKFGVEKEKQGETRWQKGTPIE